MGKSSQHPFKHQLKILEDISSIISKLMEKHGSLKSGMSKVMVRTVIGSNTPALYRDGHGGKGMIHSGVRGCDYQFSTFNPDWVEASDHHGLSFSATMEHAIGTMAFLGKFQKPGTKITCAYWILEDNPMIPSKMKFLPDPETPSHYLLVVSEGMHISELVTKLKWIDQRMAVMRDLQLEAYKNA